MGRKELRKIFKCVDMLQYSEIRLHSLIIDVMSKLMKCFFFFVERVL